MLVRELSGASGGCVCRKESLEFSIWCAGVPGSAPHAYLTYSCLAENREWAMKASSFLGIEVAIACGSVPPPEARKGKALSPRFQVVHTKNLRAPFYFPFPCPIDS